MEKSSTLIQNAMLTSELLLELCAINYATTENLYPPLTLLYFFLRKIHILGSFQNIKMARTAICNLILGKSC